MSIGFDWVSIGLSLVSCLDLLDYSNFYGILLDSIGLLVHSYRNLLDSVGSLATVCALPFPARVRVEAYFSGPAPRAWIAHKNKSVFVSHGHVLRTGFY